MSLLAWYPLINNTDSQGLDGIDLTTMGSVTYTSGKLGNVATFTGNNANCLNRPGFKLADKFSWACWFNITQSTSSSSAVQFILSEGRDYSLASQGFNILYNNSTGKLLLYYGNIATNNNIRKELIDVVLNTWYHIAVTVNSDDEIKIYINGSLVSNTPFCELDYAESNDRFVIGKMAYGYTATTSFFPMYGQVCDVRVYDHVLSPLEVKEISKGLVCHFKLSNQYETGQLNKYSGDIAEGNLATSWNVTKTKLTDERGYNYKFSYTGNGNNNWFSMNTGKTFPFTVGKKYFYSCKVRCYSKNFNLYLRAARVGNDWVTNNISILVPDGKWHEYIVSQTINENFDRAGTIVTCDPILELYSENLPTKDYVYSADFDIKDIQVIESDEYVPFIENSMVSSTVSDCSGYGNDGTIVGNMLYSGDSPRYDSSYDFNRTGYIKNDLFNLKADKMTVTCWVKLQSNAEQHFLFGSFNSWCNNGLGWYRDPNGTTISGVIKSDKESTYSGNVGFYLSLDKWRHIALVYTGTELIRYVDGVEYTRTTYGNNGTITNPVCYVGNSLFKSAASSETSESYISDFRIYATALSADDIKALYNKPSSISKSGVLNAYEFMEEVL